MRLLALSVPVPKYLRRIQVRARNGNEGVMVQLGAHLLATKCHRAAMSLLKYAAAMGSNDAAALLGDVYVEGIGVRADDVKAARAGIALPPDVASASER